MTHLIIVLLHQLANVVLTALRNMAILAVIFTGLAWTGRKCNESTPWWRKPDLMTDICFVFIPKLLNAYGQLILTVAGFSLIYGLWGKADLGLFLARGYGPLSGMETWQQAIIYLFGNDLLMYLTHRAFHSPRLWPFHAVHHSTRFLEWISAARFHPFDQILHSGLSDVVMLLLGISPEVLVLLAPWNVLSSALVHSNLNWTFGPFRYLLASPIYHRWHHTSANRGGSSNFAGTFPIFDILFGTFYMPADQGPDDFGTDDPAIPDNFIGLLAYPFRRNRGNG